MDLNKLMSIIQNSNQQMPSSSAQNINYYPQDFSSNQTQASSQTTSQQLQHLQQNNQNNLQQNFSNFLPLLAMIFGKEKMNLNQMLSKLPQFKDIQPFLSLFNKKEEKASENSTPPISSYKKIED